MKPKGEETDVSTFGLAAAGTVIFALTTWASLAFGYQIFQNAWEDDQVPDVLTAPLTVAED